MEFSYNPESGLTCDRLFTRYSDLFKSNVRSLYDAAKVRFLFRNLETTTHARYQNYFLPKIPEDVFFQGYCRNLKANIWSSTFDVFDVQPVQRRVNSVQQSQPIQSVGPSCASNHQPVLPESAIETAAGPYSTPNHQPVLPQGDLPVPAAEDLPEFTLMGEPSHQLDIGTGVVTTFRKSSRVPK